MYRLEAEYLLDNYGLHETFATFFFIIFNIEDCSEPKRCVIYIYENKIIERIAQKKPLFYNDREIQRKISFVY